MPAAFYQEMWQRIKIEKKPFEGEIINRKKNGQEYIAHATISPILNDQQELLFFLAMERDISKEKAVDRAKTEFVSFASHQLRTPLTAVRWYTEMLLSNDAGPLTDQQRKFVTEISEASLRMVQLVSALLNVSRIEMGTFSVTPEPLEIEEIIQTVLDDLQPEIKRKKIKLETNIHNIPTMLLDKKLTHIVVENLLGNAVKYTPENGIVKLDLQEVHEQRDFLGNNVPTDSLTFSVQDSGIGIPATQHDKIFSKLFRADNAVVYDTTGTGLGLYITKSIIEHSGGKIWFQSEENKGTTFTFWLPLKGMESKDGGKQLEQ